MPKIVLDDNATPQLGTSRVDVEDDEMQVLGELRAVVEVKRSKGEKSSGTRPNPGSATSFSSEEPRSAKTGVGSATFVAEHQPEPLGVLREVWSLLLELRRTHPSFVLSVEQMTGRGQFIEGLHPMPVLFPPFSPEEIKDRRPKNIGWPYLDPGAGTLRGALVARVRTTDGDVYFLEMQRRLLTPRQKEAEEKEESFKGLIFTARDARAAFEWVSRVMGEVRFRQGKRLDKLVAPRVASRTPGYTDLRRISTGRKHRRFAAHSSGLASSSLPDDLRSGSAGLRLRRPGMSGDRI